jgi:hypothetical protein
MSRECRQSTCTGGSNTHISETMEVSDHPLNEDDLRLVQTAFVFMRKVMNAKRIDGDKGVQRAYHVYKWLGRLCKVMSRNPYEHLSPHSRQSVLRCMPKATAKRLMTMKPVPMPAMYLPKRPPVRIVKDEDEEVKA